MKKKTGVTFVIALLIITGSCNRKEEADNPALSDPEFLHRSVRRLNDVVIYEIFTPPVASRIYAYACLSAYEALRWSDTSYPSLTAQMNGFTAMPAPDPQKSYHFTAAAISAFFEITERLTFTKDSSRLTRQALLEEWKRLGIDDEVYEASISFGKAIADSVWKRAGSDGYRETRGMARYTPGSQPGNWKNTPPDYLDAVEPFWKLMKPLVMDSASQFRPIDPPPFDLRTGTAFRTELQEVIDSTRNMSDEKKNIARFWDDNAAAVTLVGHMMFANKKPTPGGHWMNITAIACRKTKANLLNSSMTYAMVAAAMYDAFISCWEVKYATEYIRPVTAINENIDRSWQPFLQTPPFPEYTSGHSVVSSAIATVLTDQFGENFAFTDDYEQPYIGLVRGFPSFLKASEEACISRLYGGIHFRSAIVNGRKQGLDLGTFIVENIQTRFENGQ